MKWFKDARLKSAQRVFLLSISLTAVWLLATGCQSSSNKAARAGAASINETLGRLRPDDLVTVVFTGSPSAPDRFDGRIKQDGHISLPLVGTVLAAGKTTGDLEKEIHDLYVPRFFINLNVNVNSENRYFFVDREVKKPDRIVHSGKITVLQAIASAGGFTDFANKKKVQLIRANGEIHRINCIKAQTNPELDLEVFPGDKIIVPRRFSGN
jgi:protein involved in polysaccharide export with SLBB domain